MQSGKAFEYALCTELFDKLNNGQKITIIKNTSYYNAQNCYDLFTLTEQKLYIKSARVAVDYISDLEPRLEHSISDDELHITIQPDQQGAKGDVRDVIMVRSVHNWEIGFSAKNNHTAVKHSRLSDKIDFGKEWLGVNCSNEYMKSVGKIFGDIRTLLKQNPNQNWRDLDNKESSYYIPTLDAFEKELCSLSNNPQVPKLLLEYLLGKNDFYKIIKHNECTKIQGYNMCGTLNYPCNNIKPKNKISRLKMPRKIIDTERKQDNILIVTFDNGWTISFRIHNARTRIEPSLKFDIQLIGISASLFSHTIFHQ